MISEGRLATLVEGSSTGSYLYAADGDRLIRNQGGVKTLYLPGQELTYTGPTKAGTAVRYYTFAGTTVASRTTSAADTAMTLINDPQGTSTIAVASKTNALKQRRFDPFGNARDKTAVTWQGDHTFLNKATDTTGLTQVGARYYDSAIGSFISVDPILALGKPQQWNGYAYAGNNPTTFSDPTGMLEHGPYADTSNRLDAIGKAQDQAAKRREAAASTKSTPKPPVHYSRASSDPTGLAKTYNDWFEDSNGESIIVNSMQSYGAGAIDSVLGLFDFVTPGHIGRIGNPNKNSIYGYSDDIGNIIGPQILVGGPELGGLAKGGEAVSGFSAGGRVERSV